MIAAPSSCGKSSHVREAPRDRAGRGSPPGCEPLASRNRLRTRASPVHLEPSCGSSRFVNRGAPVPLLQACWDSSPNPGPPEAPGAHAATTSTRPPARDPRSPADRSRLPGGSPLVQPVRSSSTGPAGEERPRCASALRPRHLRGAGPSLPTPGQRIQVHVDRRSDRRPWPPRASRARVVLHDPSCAKASQATGQPRRRWRRRRPSRGKLSPIPGRCRGRQSGELNASCVKQVCAERDRLVGQACSEGGLRLKCGRGPIADERARVVVSVRNSVVRVGHANHGSYVVPGRWTRALPDSAGAPVGESRSGSERSGLACANGPAWVWKYAGWPAASATHACRRRGDWTNALGRDRAGRGRRP